MPLKFGPETLTQVTCARVRMRVSDRRGRIAEGWGETPLSVQWVWPSSISYEARHQALQQFCIQLADAWAHFQCFGHPIEVGHAFQQQVLPQMLEQFNAEWRASEQMPYLAALVCCSLFDIALHDAFGTHTGMPIYETYRGDFISRDLASYLEPAEVSKVSFGGLFPDAFLLRRPRRRLRAWHLVGGLDPLAAAQLSGDEPDDGVATVLADWIEQDGLLCLKVKLRGNDAEWDYERLVQVGQIAVQHDVQWLSADFNCTATDAKYVNEILDRLRDHQPRLFAMILYVEQPFPYDLEAHQMDVHSVAARKPLFMDESAHDWQLVKLGRRLGWNGVALKTCKTQTGALLTFCWAQAHGMALMVQDLTNPMLAQIPHLLLAAHVPTIMGVETNSMQFYPAASAPEAQVHPGIYRRRDGCVDISSLKGAGFGYRLPQIERVLPEPVATCGK